MTPTTFAVITLDAVKPFPPCDCCAADMVGTQIGVGVFLCESTTSRAAPRC